MPRSSITTATMNTSKPSARSSKQRRQKLQQAVVFIAVAGVHTLFLINMSKLMRPPSTIGDNTSNNVAMAVSFVPASVIEEPQSQGADSQTKALVTPTEPSPPAQDMAEQAQGAGTTAASMSGGSHAQDHAQAAPATVAGGGGGTKDDPYARASLRPSLDLADTFDLVARNDALFLSRVKPCFDGAEPYGVVIAVSLDDRGLVTAASPVRQGVGLALPNAQEARVMAAVKACAPYHDIVLGRNPVLKTPQSQAALAQSSPKPGL